MDNITQQIEKFMGDHKNDLAFAGQRQGDAWTKLIWLSTQMRDLMGYSLEELNNPHIRLGAFHRKDQDKMVRTVAAIFEDGQEHKTMYRIITKFRGMAYMEFTSKCDKHKRCIFTVARHLDEQEKATHFQ